MNSLPSGTVTFLFTDIEGSTDLAQVHPGQIYGVAPEIMERLAEIFHIPVVERKSVLHDACGDW